MHAQRADVAIIGAGPSGLLLGHMLKAEGLNPVVIERKSAEYVLSRIRAGVLERTTTNLLDRLGINDRMNAEGILHDGFELGNGERTCRINMAELVDGQVMVYGQTEVQKDLIDAAEARDLTVIWEADDVAVHDIESAQPYVTFAQNGVSHRIDATLIAGCDGFHGPSRRAIPASAGCEIERAYPFGWLGILADVPPCWEELIYANHERGFALASMRSETRSRYYIQVPLTEKIEDWSDDRIWDELAVRLGPEPAAKMTRGPSIEKSIAPLRSYVFEPMNHGRLFLAGDSAHIVPPTGAKGLNLAASDVIYLGEAMARFFKSGDETDLQGYGQRALARVWKSERFSWYLTRLTHRFPEDTAFDRRMQIAEFEYIESSEAMRRTIAENYVGLPL